MLVKKRVDAPLHGRLQANEATNQVAGRGARELLLSAKGREKQHHCS
jgi:hypothetical protein